MRKTRTLVLLVTLFLALTAPPAVARESGTTAAGPAAVRAETLTQVIGDPVTTPSSNTTQFFEARVSCPAGQTPTGGGPKVSPSYNALTMISSYAIGGTWIVTAKSNSSTDGTLWATAICSTEPHSQVFNGPLAVPARSEGGLSAQCPPGQYATGGGGRTDLGSVSVMETFAGGNDLNDRWSYYINNPTGMTHYVEPFVVCSSSPHHHYWGDDVSLPLFHGTAGSVKYCPSGSVTGGGGFALGTSLYESSAWGNGWLASAVNESAGHSVLHTEVVCKD